MNDIQTSFLLVPLLLPLLTALCNLLTGKSPNVRDTCSIVGATATFISVATLYPTS